MLNNITTSYEHVERGQVVAYEENVVWEEDHVVKEVYQEVSYAVLEQSVLGIGVL